MSDQVNQAKAQVGQGPLSPTGVAALKVAIVVMGIMIIVGVAVVIGRIFYLISTSPSSTTAVVEQTVPQLQPDASVNLPLPAGARIQNIALDGSHLAITFRIGDKPKIAIFDLNTRKQITQIQLTTKPTLDYSIPQAE